MPVTDDDEPPARDTSTLEYRLTLTVLILVNLVCLVSLLLAIG